MSPEQAADLARRICATQLELAKAFHEIEFKNGFHSSPVFAPVDLNTHAGQAVLRRYAWQITEEISEAFDSLESDMWEDFRGEMSDALHFVIELGLLIDIEPRLIRNVFEKASFKKTSRLFRVRGDMNDALMRFIADLGRWANRLKLRPWKRATDHPPLNIYILHEKYTCLLEDFFSILIGSGISLEMVEESFFKTSDKNKNRIADGT